LTLPTSGGRVGITAAQLGSIEIAVEFQRAVPKERTTP
jgi:hypothetical protein